MCIGTQPVQLKRLLCGLQVLASRETRGQIIWPRDMSEQLLRITGISVHEQVIDKMDHSDPTFYMNLNDQKGIRYTIIKGNQLSVTCSLGAFKGVELEMGDQHETKTYILTK